MGSTINYYCCLFCFPDCSDFGRWELFQVGSCAFWRSILLFLELFHTFCQHKVLQTQLVILSDPNLESATSPRNSVTVDGKLYLKTRIWLLSVLIAQSFSRQCFYSLLGHRTEKAMAPHSSTLAWKILWMEEPCGPQSMGLLRVRQDSATSLWLFTFMHWRRKWQPTPVFLPGESQGWGSLVGCCLWGCTESDMTEVT